MTPPGTLLLEDGPGSLAPPNVAASGAARGPLPARRTRGRSGYAGAAWAVLTGLAGSEEEASFSQLLGSTGPIDRLTPGRPVGFTPSGLSRVSPTVLPAHASGTPAEMSERLAQKMSQPLCTTERGRWPSRVYRIRLSLDMPASGVPNEETPIGTRGFVGRCCYPQPRAFDNPHDAASGDPGAAFVRGVSDIHLAGVDRPRSRPRR